MKKALVFGISALALTLAGPQAIAAKAKKIKIGFVTTLSGGPGVIGKDMRNSVQIALDHLGGKMGGIPVEVIFEDDQVKPEVGKQKTEKLLHKDKVDIVSGFIWSHVVLASRNSVVKAGKFLIISNAGTSKIAGRLCHKNIFSTSWQNDQVPMAMGEVLNKRGVKSLYVVAPNYAAGRDMVAGVERTFKGKILGKDLTKWPTQLDFSAELAKARASKADGVFIFYPGRATNAFMRQYAQAGLTKTPLYSVFSVDSLSLPKLQQAKLQNVLGTYSTQFWSPDLDTPVNKKFVADYRKKFGSYPSHYGAQSYDSIMLIDSAVRAVGGDLKKMDAMRAAFRKADYGSVRGKYVYGNNHFPIQDFYLREVVKDSDGKWTTKIVQKVYSNHQDVYAKKCKMKKTW
ncbi:MAG: ABC transporter substrate-binding protein [Rhodospirillaceae bacterium]|nr:ABC transporter substrate-binding protein [Rhodospirillaceae bacterium]|tara:strand:- start:4367 stop:5566 length:1200 start_codon:yes stop_codon:yes gene_type:complete